MNKKVSRFNVSVDDIFFVNFFKTVTDLLEDVNDLIFREFSSLTFYILLEISLTIFEEKVQMLFGFSRFVESKLNESYLTMLGLLSFMRI